MPRTYKRKTDRPYARRKPQALPAKFRAGFLSELDKRTELARTLRASYAAIVADAGGPAEVTHVKAALAERFCWLEAILRTLEQDMASGNADRADTLGKWIQAVNSLSGLAKVLGVDRKGADAVRADSLAKLVIDWDALYERSEKRTDPIEEMIRAGGEAS